MSEPVIIGRATLYLGDGCHSARWSSRMKRPVLTIRTDRADAETERLKKLAEKAKADKRAREEAEA